MLVVLYSSYFIADDFLVILAVAGFIFILPLLFTEV
jgi:hypothetical protein